MEMVVPEISELTGVRCVLGDHVVFRDLTLTIDEGTRLVVQGANGSGKSTLLRAMLGLLVPSQGRIRLASVDVKDFTSWFRIGYAPQTMPDCSATPLSLREFVATGLVGATATKPDAIRTILTEMELWTRRSQSVHSLSGGQQRRALIARALIREPDILFLDEPTAGVDETGAELLAGLLGKSQSTMILVTHERDAVFDLGNRYVVLGTGREPDITYDGSTPPTRPAAAASQERAGSSQRTPGDAHL
jgi:zinc transport system ATP-binding protein